MRTTLLPSLLECLERNNNNHGQPTGLFEVARVYCKSKEADALPQEPLHLALGFYGGGDFYDLKGAVEAIMKDAGIHACFTAFSQDKTFHPGRCAQVTDEKGTVLGRLGQLHPQIARGIWPGPGRIRRRIRF